MEAELFQYLKPCAFARLLDMSQSRFSQKLHNHKVRGIPQKFTDKELMKLKQNLLVLAEYIAEKI